ncbi:MAG: hypothetical protein AB8B97_03185 [Granulosicoccus sp.]
MLGVDSSPFTANPSIDPPPHPVDVGYGIYALPPRVNVHNLPKASEQLESVQLRTISIGDSFGQTLLGPREVTITA